MRNFFLLFFLLHFQNLFSQDYLKVDYKNEKSFFWRDNGILKYKGKVFSGQIFENFRNGKLKYIETYLSGKMEGIHEGFYKSGIKKFSHGHKNGLEDGRFEYYFKNGVLSQKGLTVGGKTQSIEIFDKKGIKKIKNK